MLNREKWEGTRKGQGYRKSETLKGNVWTVVPESNTRWVNTRARKEKGRQAWRQAEKTLETKRDALLDWEERP